MTTFSKKGVYHSELVPATEQGQLIVRFTRGPIGSKHKDGEFFIPFEIDGGDSHTYTIENPTVKAYLEQVPQNEWVQWFAAGSREQATVMCHDSEGQDVVPNFIPPDTTTFPAEEQPSSGGFDKPKESGFNKPADGAPKGFSKPAAAPTFDPIARFKEVYNAIYIEVSGAVAETDEYPFAAVIEAAKSITVTEMIGRNR